MHHKRSGVSLQQRCFQQQVATTDSYTVFNLLTHDTLLHHVERLSPDYRERLFTPTETLSMFVAQALSADRSCQNIVNQAATKRLIEGLNRCSPRTGGYCRARQRLPQDMISGISTILAEHMSAQTPAACDWHHRRVCLVDGTTMSMPDTPANQAAFPQQGNQAPGLGFPICRWVGITCLASGALLNAAIGRFNGKGANEQALLREILDTFEVGDIVLGDAFYPTWFLLAELQHREVDVLMEQHGPRRRSTDFRCGTRLGERDHLIELPKPKKPSWLTQQEYDRYPKTLMVREFKASGKIMVSTLLCPKSYPKTQLKQLYRQRWNIELDLRSIKDTMGMNILSCQTPQMIRKEIWVYLLAYNLIRFLMLTAALQAGIMPRQISFKHSMQLALAWMQLARFIDDECAQNILKAMAAQQVANRPGRIEPRAVKRRPKAFALLTERRDQARERLKINGHPR